MHVAIIYWFNIRLGSFSWMDFKEVFARYMLRMFIDVKHSVITRDTTGRSELISLPKVLWRTPLATYGGWWCRSAPGPLSWSHDSRKRAGSSASLIYLLIVPSTETFKSQLNKCSRKTVTPYDKYILRWDTDNAVTTYCTFTIIFVFASSSYFTLAVSMREVSCVVYKLRAWDPRTL